jgi:cob(I)alamin adenosyltransferase
VNLLAVRYLNRLSDLLFILTRVVNGTAAEVLWVPGGERTTQLSGPQPVDGAQTPPDEVPSRNEKE